MATAAAAHKAKYNSLTKAQISLSYGLTYPETLMRKMDKQKHVATGGWFWTTAWSTFSAFKGTFNNGAKDVITSLLWEVTGMIQNAINFAFPLPTQSLAHAVFTKQLLLSRGQALEWIEALEPLYEILLSAGMSLDDAWERVLIFTKAMFDDVWTVQALTLNSKNTAGMIWGSFRTTKLLEEYRWLKFYQPPHVSNMLVLTSLQRKGKKVEKTLSALGTLTKDVEKLKSQCGQCKKDVKALNNAKWDIPGGGGESPLPVGVMSGTNDWGPTRSTIFQGKLQAIMSRMGIGRRPRSKVWVRVVGEFSLGWVEALEA
jgi:hypothetical protein